MVLSLYDRDPVDALNDVEFLCTLFSSNNPDQAIHQVALDIDRDPTASHWLKSALTTLRLAPPPESLARCINLHHLCQARLSGS